MGKFRASLMLGAVVLSSGSHTFRLPPPHLGGEVDYLIDEVLPTQRVNLLGGVSDAGKTRWVIPAMLAWEQGLPVLGRNSHPVPWVYVAGDRTVREVWDSMTTMALSPNALRILPAFGAKKFKKYYDVLDALSRWDPLPEFIVWEGFSDLCGESKPEVAEFLGCMSSYCEPSYQFPKGLTVLGVVESPKLKSHEKYHNPRHRVSGVSSWGFHSSTIMLIEAFGKDEALESDQRTFWVCAKNAKRRKLTACFDAQGRLIVP